MDWKPSQPNGWWPKLAPNAQWVAYGNWATCVANLVTGVEYQVPLQLKPPEGFIQACARLSTGLGTAADEALTAGIVRVGTGSYPHGWYTDSDVFVSELFTTYVDGVLKPDVTRALYTVHVPDMAVTMIACDPHMAAGNVVCGDRGHYATWNAGGGAVVYDGAQLVRSTGGPLAQCSGLVMSGEWLVTADTTQGYQFLVYRSGKYIQERARGPENDFVLLDGYLAYGNPGVKLSDPDGNVIDAAVVTWGLPESPAALCWDGPVLWLWTFTWSGSQGGQLLGRPITDASGGLAYTDVALVVPASQYALSLSVRATDTDFVLAGNSDTGALRVWSVLKSAPRVKVAPPPADPVTPLAPLGRPLLFGYHKVAGRYGIYTEQAMQHANCAVLGANWGDWDITTQNPTTGFQTAAAVVRVHGGQFFGAPDLATMRLCAPFWDSVAAIYVTPEGLGADVDTFDVPSVETAAMAAINNMKTLGLARRPILCYYDGTLEDARFRVPRYVDWMCVRTYQANQPDAAAAKAEAVRLFQAQAARVPATMAIVVVAQSYDLSGAWKNPNSLMDIQPVALEMARQDARVVGIVLFSYSRPGGVLTYPALAQWHAAMFAAIPGAPPVVTIPSGQPVEAPVATGITIIDWSRAAKVGQPASVYFQLQHSAPITKVLIDLIGDGDPATEVTCADAREIAGAYFVPRRPGTFGLVVSMADVTGKIVAQTGLRRDVVVS